jgi:hypothetical protein
VTTAEMGTRRSRPGDLHRRRVLLLAESAGLAAVLHHLLDPSDRLSRIGSLRELAETRALEHADVVMLDVPAQDRAAAVGQVRRRYLGPLVVLVDRADRGGLRPDDACTLLTRPFAASELAAALDAPVRSPRSGPFWAMVNAAGPPLTSPPATTAHPGGAAAAARGPADPARAAIDPKAAARKAPVRPAPVHTPGKLDVIQRAQLLLGALTRSWQARRRVRVAGFSVIALVAFTVAFALAANGRCGPGCDAFGTVFSSDPTVAPNESRAPATPGPKHLTSTTARAGSPQTGAFGGISDGGPASTTTAERRATTTTDKPSSGGGAGTTTPTTQPPTTQPPTTQPPTTQPPTTQPPTTPPPTTAGA